MFEFGVVTLFPELFSTFLKVGVVGRAFQNQLLKCHFANPRDFTQDKYHTVDDRPYGGGPGMVMMAEPLAQAVDFLKHRMQIKPGQSVPVCYLSPQGQVFQQHQADELSRLPDQKLILICGRYEGIDERFIKAYVDFELSIGDYVLSGGEVPAQVVIDAIARLMPGVLGESASHQQDSFSEENLLDCPHYTRPVNWRGQQVPDVLLSGHHENIAKWRTAQSQARTEARRPDLYIRAGSNS